MDTSLAFYLVAILSVVMTGISKSGFAGGLGALAVPLMCLFVTPQFAAAVMMPILLAMDVLIVWRYRNTWERKVLFALLPAAIVGLLLGGLTFEHMNADTVRLMIGLLAAFFVIQYLVSQSRQQDAKPMAKPIVWLLGMISGFSSFIAHAGGPPIKGYLLQQKLEKSWFVGTNTVFFFTLNLLKTFAYGASGTLSMASLQTSALLSPFLLVGIAIGVRLHGAIDQKLFVKIVYSFLAIAAIQLLYDSGTAMLL